MDRKKFLASASVLAIASLRGSSLLSASLGNPSKLLPIIDTHLHLADLVRLGKDWATPPVPGNYGPDAYKEAIRNVNIVKAVYMEVAASAARKHEEALYAIEICKDKSNPVAAAVISGNLMSANFESYMMQFKGSEYIRGIRHKFRSAAEMKDPLLISNVKVLGNLNMSLDLTISPSWLPAVAKLVKSCPGTKFMIDHCGNVNPEVFIDPSLTDTANRWIEGMKAVAQNKNVFCKISGIVIIGSGYTRSAETLGPPINHSLDIFGPNRVVFASDWPWCLKSNSLEEWVNIVKEVVRNRPYKEQKKLFHDNAIKFYNI